MSAPLLRLGPVLEALREHGSLTHAQIVVLAGLSRKPQSTINSNFHNWTSRGWLVLLSTDEPRSYGPGPKATSYAAAPVLSVTVDGKRKRLVVDLTADADSDQSYVLGQLEHGPLKSGDVAALLDKSINRAERVLQMLRKLGYVERLSDKTWVLLRAERVDRS